jgi:putative redox protein
MTSSVIYLGDLRTKAVHLASQDTINTDAPVDNQGKGEKFSPTDLVATALGSCALTIMGIAANTHGFNINGSSVGITKTMGTNPRRIVQIDLNFKMKGDNFNDKQKQIIMHAAKTCPVFYSLNDEMIKNIAFEW